MTTQFNPSRKVTPAKFLAGLHAPLDPGRREYLPVAPYHPVGYLAQAAGIGAGRLLGASPLVLFYLGRLGALGAWLALVFLAIRTTPVLGWTYLLLALMPMTLSLAASNSVDASVIGVSFLLSAQLLAWAYDGERARIDWADYARVVVLALVLALVKPVYLALLVLFYLVPRRKIGSAVRYHLVVPTIIVLCVATDRLWGGLAAWAVAPGPAIDLARHGTGSLPVPDVAPERQLAFMVSRPFAFLRVLLSTFATFYGFYLRSFVGILGWLDTRLPGWVAVAYVTATAAVSFLSSHERVTWKTRCVGVGIFALTFLAALVGMYMNSSSVGMSRVLGFQGRYLIPVAPAVCLMLLRRRSRWSVTNGLAVALIAFTMLTTSVAGYCVVKRFYVADTSAGADSGARHRGLG
jgi:uncharacterized membrane protein